MVLLTLLGVFSVIVIGINFLLKRTVIYPLQKMAKIAESVSMGNMDSEFEQKTEDEIGTLAKAFNRMKSSLAMAKKQPRPSVIGLTGSFIFTRPVGNSTIRLDSFGHQPAAIFDYDV